MSTKPKAHKCGTCARTFGSAAAQKQHRAAAHATPSGQRAPVVDARGGAGVTLSGVDMLSSVRVSSATPMGKILLSLPLTPQGVPQTRWAAMSAPWVRWRPRLLKLEVISSAPTTLGGTYIVGWTGDNPLPWQYLAGDEVVRAAMSVQSASVVDIHSSTTFSVPLTMPVKWYEEGGDNVHGTLFIVLVAPVVGSSQGSVMLTLKLHWGAMYELPRFDAAPHSGLGEESAFAANTDGYAYLTYRSTFPAGLSDKLLVHAKLDGQYARCYGARRHVIYRLAGTTLDVGPTPYVFFVRPRDGGDSDAEPALLAAPSFTAAGNYLRTGNADYLSTWAVNGEVSSALPLVWVPMVHVEPDPVNLRECEVDQLTSRIRESLLAGSSPAEVLEQFRDLQLGVRDQRLRRGQVQTNRLLRSTMDSVPGGSAFQVLNLDPAGKDCCSNEGGGSSFA